MDWIGPNLLILPIVSGRPSPTLVSPTMANTSRSRAQEITSILCVLSYLFFCGYHDSVGAVRDGNRCAAVSGTSASQLTKSNVASFQLRYRILRANETA